MILVMGSQSEPMVTRVRDELARRGAESFFVSSHDMPGTVQVGVSPGAGGFLRLSDDRRISMSEVSAVYQRLGFHDAEMYQDYSAEERQYANTECLAACNVLLDAMPGRVVNPPHTSGSNASKPYQIGLIAPHGFRTPRTLVTNRPDQALAFYELLEGQVIYKSISYLRSIVQVMQPADLERLDTLGSCPVQLQERVDGTDIRVHVVGDDVLFPSIIQAEESDYRYDKSAEITEHALPPEIERACFAVTRALGFLMAGIDLRVTPEGEYYCFEVNPSPAFTWYEDRTGQPITAALCDLLQSLGARP